MSARMYRVIIFKVIGIILITISVILTLKFEKLKFKGFNFYLSVIRIRTAIFLLILGLVLLFELYPKS